VYSRPNAIWPFTVVGRPPQEDSFFGQLIHEITKPVLPDSIPGVVSLNAVDAAGVHPLLLATAEERYVPYQEKYPMELLTLANAILGFGHCSLAKYLIIADASGDSIPDVNDIRQFFIHVLERVDFKRDLHFQTRTTIDTLDYSGTAVNQGSKVVIAAAGPKKRSLSSEIPLGITPADGFSEITSVIPGVAAIQAPKYHNAEQTSQEVADLENSLVASSWPESLPLIVMVDDSRFTSESLNNFLWVTFTRSNPASDIHGVHSFSDNKHWGCKGALIIDARLKPHHAPPLTEDPDTVKKVENLLKHYN
jgi:4-hydroxy-3-polyprenylbenzoate decarboxylase